MSAELRSNDSVTICEPAMRMTEIAASSLKASSRCLSTSKVMASTTARRLLQHEVAELVGRHRLARVDHERRRRQLNEGRPGDGQAGRQALALENIACDTPAVEEGLARAHRLAPKGATPDGDRVDVEGQWLPRLDAGADDLRGGAACDGSAAN